ncbi:MAG: hypothetical protein RLZZ406_1373 [Pseudomonadota bacterium]
MTTVRLRENEPFEVALRRFKRTIEKNGLLTDLRAREFYEKPTAERKRKKAAAAKRHYKRIRSQMLPKNAAGFCFSNYQIQLDIFNIRNKAMSLKDQITEDMKNAMRAKETARLGAIRLLLAAIKQREVDDRIVLDDAAVIAIIEKMMKQRKDSISQFEKAKRDDLVAIEVAEMTILQTYLPAQMSDAEVEAAVAAAVNSTGASGPQDMGKVIGALKGQLAGKADMGKVSALVKAALAK